MGKKAGWDAWKVGVGTWGGKAVEKGGPFVSTFAN